MILRAFAYSIGSIVAVLAAGTLLPPDWVTYDGQQAVVLFGLVLGLLSTFLKPMLSALTMPISCLTFGVFSVILNGALFWLAAQLVPGMSVSYVGAALGGVLAAIINGVIYSVVDEH
ncbi:MAG TPA: phage holin family protein [Thermomicrobiales bacterium]|nr:phage holin family protein [Thermomicrobiales bacterium]